MLESVTLEEANSDFVNWIKQRSRWYKGYLQTFLIHMRHPVLIYRQLGWRAFWGFVLFVGGTPLLACLNPLFWVMTGIWFVGGHLHLIQQVFPAPVVLPGHRLLDLRQLPGPLPDRARLPAGRRPELLGAALLVPVYWAMMALAAAKAMWQLVSMPTFWEKTTHGLDSPAPAGSAGRSPARVQLENT